MATLQKIRSKGPLLLIVIGFALFAFIASDAWRILQPQMSQDVGEVNGKSISVQQYQDLIDEYTDVVKLTSGMTTLTEEQTNQIKDEAWRNYINNKLVEDQAKKIGLTVSKEEIQAIISEGSHPLLMQTPFYNPQTGVFDQDGLKKVLADYARYTQSGIYTPEVEYYGMLARYWNFIEKNLIQTRLAEKYQALISQSLKSNPVEAEFTFDGRVNQSDVLLAAIPYSSVPDSLIRLKESELKSLYNKKKEQFRRYAETRNIKYVDVQVVPSEEDRAALQSEMVEYTEQLHNTHTDYTNFIRSTASDYPYIDLYYTRNAFPADVAARIDSTSVGEVYGPYYNAADNTFNAFKIVAKATLPDSVEVRQFMVLEADLNRQQAVVDSILAVLKAGADFDEVAQSYGQNGESRWISSQDYEGAQLSGDDVKFLNTLSSLNTREIGSISLVQGPVILQVLNKKSNQEKYKVAVVKRTVEYSKATYDRMYNEFSQFIAANPTIEQLTENAEESGYRLLERNELYSSEHMIGGVRGTKDALRWVFNAKPGDVSNLYEVGESNDRLFVVALAAVNKEGYTPLSEVQQQLKAELIRDKKAEKIIADMKASGATSFEQYKNMENAVSDSIRMVTFSAPAYVSVLRSSEPLVGAYASVAELNQVSRPIQGNAGVMVLQVYSKEKLNDTFEVKTEKETLADTQTRMASRYINDLYLKAKVKDNRYVFF
ncbi:MAG: SurA N-terminal domain-containing protein [Bacteroides sp.]|nr:SurA N-terminal domain-containing protein [Bacteroides sp.]